MNMNKETESELNGQSSLQNEKEESKNDRRQRDEHLEQRKTTSDENDRGPPQKKPKNTAEPEMKQSQEKKLHEMNNSTDQLAPTFKVVVYDLETNRLRNAHICQIGSLSLHDDEHSFSSYVLPLDEIDPESSKVNGLTIEMDNEGHRKLFKNGSEIKTVEISQALKSWVESLEEFRGGNKIILVAHNGESFDHPALLNAFKTCKRKEPEFSAVYDSFVKSGNYFMADSMLMLRESKEPALKHFSRFSRYSFSMEKLYRTLMGFDIPNAHDALGDCKKMSRR